MNDSKLPKLPLSINTLDPRSKTNLLTLIDNETKKVSPSIPKSD